MRVAAHLVEARRERLATLLKQHRYLPLQELCSRLEISEATARRDLTALVQAKVITRTYGGALADFNTSFASFAERQRRAPQAKKKIARAAHRLIQSGMTCYLDSGTTMLFLAEQLKQRPVEEVTIVTNNWPVAEILAEIPGCQVHLLGGLLLRRQFVLMGEKACRNVRFWNFDLAFLAAEGMTAQGIYNSQNDIVRFQHAVCARAHQVIVAMDATKIGLTAPEFLLPWSEIDLLITDAKPARLNATGIHLSSEKFHSVTAAA